MLEDAVGGADERADGAGEAVGATELVMLPKFWLSWICEASGGGEAVGTSGAGGPECGWCWWTWWT